MPEIFVSPDKPAQGHKKRRRLFASYSSYPEDISFENKEKGEKVILMLRQHPIVNLRWISISILLFLIPAVVLKLGFLSFLPAGYPVAEEIWSPMYWATYSPFLSTATTLFPALSKR